MESDFSKIMDIWLVLDFFLPIAGVATFKNSELEGQTNMLNKWKKSDEGHRL